LKGGSFSGDGGILTTYQNATNNAINSLIRPTMQKIWFHLNLILKYQIFPRLIG